jgi:hypothetical protein
MPTNQQTHTTLIQGRDEPHRNTPAELLTFSLKGEHTFLYITALYIAKKTVSQYANTGQCRNTSR